MNERMNEWEFTTKIQGRRRRRTHPTEGAKRAETKTRQRMGWRGARSQVEGASEGGGGEDSVLRAGVPGWGPSSSPMKPTVSKPVFSFGTVFSKTFHRTTSNKRKKIDTLDFLFLFLAAPRGLWDLSSPTRDWTPGPQQWKGEVLTTGPPGNSLYILSIRNLLRSMCLQPS